jgi:two-component system nitrogen regulation sensor histidine kinase GlnL
MPARLFPGLDLLASAAILVDERLRIVYANPAAENLFAFSLKNVADQPLPQLFTDAGGLEASMQHALVNHWS